MWFSPNRYCQSSQVILTILHMDNQLRVPVAPYPCPHLVLHVFLQFCSPDSPISFNFFSLRWNSHKINLLKVNDSVAFSTLRMLCNHHLYLVQNTSSTQGKFCNYDVLTPYSLTPPHQSMITANPHSVSRSLSILGISYKLNHTYVTFLLLDSFS